ncbi:hypothetical protein AB0D97_25395, partial [Streptomyces roseus]|uniref:hypothetical protein n=1 Tax=Streptomyces roseus TaxID=66430 RepID=UPI0033DEE38F
YQLLALIFGTLLSSQGTDASFVLTLSGFPPGFVLSFPTLSESVPLAFQVLRFRAFPFRRCRLYQKFSTGFPGFGFLDEESTVPHWNSIPVGGEKDFKPSLPNLSSSRQPFESTSPRRLCQQSLRDDQETSS